jgi:predicted DNA-binding helix-hairpin-helix protein
MLLRVPGFGTKTVARILATRRHRGLRYDDLCRMGAAMKKAAPFVSLRDWTPGALTDSAALRARFAPRPQQLRLI